MSTSTSMPLSYAQAVNPSGQASNPSLEPLCPYAEATGICKKPECTYLHGDICELCGRAALHPYDEEQRKKHTNVSYHCFIYVTIYINIQYTDIKWSFNKFLSIY